MRKKARLLFIAFTLAAVVWGVLLSRENSGKEESEAPIASSDVLSEGQDEQTSIKTLNMLSVAKGDYPWWRGPSGNDIVESDTKAPLSWSKEKNIRWKTPIPGRGFGTPTLVGNRIYLPTAILDKESDTISISFIILNRKSGEMIKQKELRSGKKFRVHADNSYATSTIACDGERLFYPYVINEHLYLDCLDMELNLLWSKDLGAYSSAHGYAGSALLYGDTVIICTDRAKTESFLGAYDRKTGDLCWKTDRGNMREPPYVTPALIYSSGQAQIIMNGPDITCSYNPKNGEKLWEVSGPSNCCPSSPAWDESRVYLAGGWPKRIMMAVASDGSRSEPIWKKTRPVTPYVPSLLFKDGLLYCLSDEGNFFCLEAKDGELLWSEKLKERFYSSPVLIGDRIYIFGRSGGAWIFQVGSQKALLAENRLESGVWATPVFADDGIYLRTLDYLCFITEEN